MNWRLIFVVGGLLGGCEVGVQAGACRPSNCSGCCDGAGQCQPGLEPATCGIQGNRCVACEAGLSCNAGACGVLSGSGGGGGSGGGNAAGGTVSSVGGETCAMAAPLSLSAVPGDAAKQRASVMSTTVGAMDDEGAALSSCGGNGGPDRFYSVEVPASRVLSVKVITGGAWPGVVRLRSRSCTEPDDRCRVATPGATTASVETIVQTATRYVITVDGADGGSGPFELQIETRLMDGDAGVGYCSRLLTAQSRFFAAGTRCEDRDAGVAVVAEVAEPNCVARLPLCTAAELPVMNTYLDCYERLPVCTAGQEATALAAFDQCAAPIRAASTSGALSGTCRDALRR